MTNAIRRTIVNNPPGTLLNVACHVWGLRPGLTIKIHSYVKTSKGDEVKYTVGLMAYQIPVDNLKNVISFGMLTK